MTTISNISPSLDKYAILTSSICAIHCLSLPLIVGVFPALSTSIFGQEQFHVLLLWLVIPLSLVSLTLGFKQHHSGLVALLGLSGLTVLILAGTIGHDTLGEAGERIATLLGATLIAAGHLRNYKLCKQSKCTA